MSDRRLYVRVACEAMHRIARALQEGRVWYFEDLPALLQSERNDPQRALVEARRRALESLIHWIVDMLDDLESGVLRPQHPPTLMGIVAIMSDRLGAGRYSRQGLTRRWVYDDVVRRSCGAPVCYYGLAYYLATTRTSHPGVLRPVTIPTWWLYFICRVHGGEALGLTPDTLIYVTRGSNGELLWDWEPRGDWALRSIPPYEWFFDRDQAEVFILIEGRRHILLEGGRLEEAQPGRRRARRPRQPPRWRSQDL